MTIIYIYLYYILTEPILTQNEHSSDTALDFWRN